jgi:hypothetical protein
VSQTEKQNFDQAMKKILSVSKQELQRRLEEEKKAKGKN